MHVLHVLITKIGMIWHACSVCFEFAVYSGQMCVIACFVNFLAANKTRTTSSGRKLHRKGNKVLENLPQLINLLSKILISVSTFTYMGEFSSFSFILRLLFGDKVNGSCHFSNAGRRRSRKRGNFVMYQCYINFIFVFIFKLFWCFARLSWIHFHIF